MRPDESLFVLSELYRQRNEEYGDNYKNFGAIIEVMFPNGIHLSCASDFNRIAVLFHILDKITRYIANFDNGGHQDSLDDVSVYAQMLKELDLDRAAVQTRDEKRTSSI